MAKRLDIQTYVDTIAILEDNMKILHPFMPFITEEIWQYIKERSPEEAIIIAKYPEHQDFDENFLKQAEQMKEVISNIRKVRKEKNIPQREAVSLSVLEKETLQGRIKKNYSKVRKCQFHRKNGFSF